MKSSFNKESSNVYLLNPNELLNSNVQVNRMSRDNCYSFCSKRKNMSLVERQKQYDSLLNKIKRDGFSKDNPVLIMLNRDSNGNDKIIDGHHRLSIALDIGLTSIPVKFVYALSNSIQELK